jgi:hypothetical protein
METITSRSNRKWLFKKKALIDRYIRKYHNREDYETLFNLIYWFYPDEGRKLIQNYRLPFRAKLIKFLEWIILQPAIVCGVYGDQRQGKDATLCYLFEEAINYCKYVGVKPPRIVTLGNIKKPPFVQKKDMYFSFLNIPPGTEEQEIWVYSSEMELVIPSREGRAAENRLFDQLCGTFAQNHQKLFGCCKLASKVDINFIRNQNAKIFKYISPDKLAVKNVERDNILSGLGRWLLPSEVNKKDEVLLSFDQQLFHVQVPLPEWWTNDYSEQYSDIPMESIWDYVVVQYTNGMKIPDIVIAVKHKFRYNLSIEQVKNFVIEAKLSMN